MKSIRKLTLTGVLLAIALGLTLLWSQTHAKADEDVPAADKWTQIQNNDKKMLDDLGTIKENLDFARARAMQNRK